MNENQANLGSEGNNQQQNLGRAENGEYGATPAAPTGAEAGPASPWAAGGTTPARPAGDAWSTTAQTPVTPASPWAAGGHTAAQPTASLPTASQPAASLPAAESANPWTYAQTYPTSSQSWPQTQTQPAVPARTPGRGRRAVVATVAGAALAVTAGGVGGFVGYTLHGNTANGPLQTVSSPVSNGKPATVLDRSSLASIAASVQPTVVVVDTGNAEGSGVITSADGYIVTNNHVVAGAQGDTVQVTFNSGRRVTARIVGTDTKTDLAVVKADVSGLTYATWGDSDAVQVGDTVLAIGSPLGLQGSVTAGIVSALHRTITVGGDQQSQLDNSPRTTIGDAIQTDAPINPGNSGGALVNMNGQVIGINSAIATSGSSGNIGVGFAISANRAKAVSEQLIKGGKVSHPYLGISVGNATNGGAQIQQVTSGSPAAAAGLQAGDVVTKVGNRNISGSEDLIGAVQSSTVGQKLNLTVVRNGSEQTVTATVGEAP
jgi:putative serine protease PepD